MCIRDRATRAALDAVGDVVVLGALPVFIDGVTPVSYTHLDVYKRQVHID